MLFLAGITFVSPADRGPFVVRTRILSRYMAIPIMITIVLCTYNAVHWQQVVLPFLPCIYDM